MESEDVDDLKHSKKIRGVRWGIRTSNTVRRSRQQAVRFRTKREHRAFVVMNRDEENKINAGDVWTYMESNFWENIPREVRNRPVEGLPHPEANINHYTAISVVHYSLDKKKRWEMIEDAKKAQKGRLALTRSYSDTDEIDDNDGESSTNDSDEDPMTSIPKVAVVERTVLDYQEYRKTDYGSMNLGNTFIQQSTADKPLDDAEEPRFVVTQGRKGRVVREKRAKGKKGVVRATHHNSHSKYLQDLASADTMIAVGVPDNCHHINHGQSRDRICCKLCNPPKPNAHNRDHGSFQKKLLEL